MRHVYLCLLILWIVPITQAQTRPFAEGFVDDDIPYLGQPIVYTLQVYSENIFDDSIVIEPDFTGFGRSSVDIPPTTYTEEIEGITYNVIEQNYVIYPLRTGDLTIGIFQIEIPATPFSPEWIVFTNTVDISVNAYPEPMPEGFRNGIGQFSITSDAFPTTLQSGNALTLSATVSGTGNLEQLLPPMLDVPETWQVFDSNVRYQQDNVRFGSTTFEWTVIVEGDGSTSFPTIIFSYFNPQTEQYETRNTAPIDLIILASTAVPTTTIERDIADETIQITPPLLVDTNIKQLVPHTLPFWFWLLWLVPPMILFVIWIASQRSNQPKQRPSQRQQRRAKSKAFKVLDKQLRAIPNNQPKKAYQALSEAIYAYISAKTGLDITAQTIENGLVHFSEQDRVRLARCLDEALSGQYAPITEDDVQTLKRQIKQTCDAIEKAML